MVKENRGMPGAPEPREVPDVIIVGAGRHGRNVLDVVGAIGCRVAGFLDDTKRPGDLVNGAPVLGGFDAWRDPSLLSTRRFIVAVGDNDARLRTFAAIRAAGGRLASAVHPSCIVSPSARLGLGVFLGAYCRVLANGVVGDYCLVEGLSTLGADSVLEEGVALGPGCQITAGGYLGACAFLGAGAAVVESARVGAGSVIGAGAVVLSDIPPGVFAAGVPAVVKRTLR